MRRNALRMRQRPGKNDLSDDRIGTPCRPAGTLLQLGRDLVETALHLQTRLRRVGNLVRLEPHPWIRRTLRGGVRIPDRSGAPDGRIRQQRRRCQPGHIPARPHRIEDKEDVRRDSRTLPPRGVARGRTEDGPPGRGEDSSAPKRRRRRTYFQKTRNAGKRIGRRTPDVKFSALSA